MSHESSHRLPSWASKEYFTNILTKHVQHFDTIVAIESTNLEDSYTSIILRVTIDYQLKDGSQSSYHLILKSMPETQTLYEFMKFLGQFPKEKLIYDTLLPRLTNMYKDRPIQFGPYCVHTEEIANRITLLLEDLQGGGYSCHASDTGFDMPHMKSALQKLAAFHAASVIYEQQFGPYEEQFHVGLVSEKSRKFFEQRSSSMLQAFTAANEEWQLSESEYEECQRKLPNSQQFVDRLISLSRRGDTAVFNVLNHGDFWRVNILFRYNDDGAIEDSVFLDFQLCKVGPPSYDLYLFILTSAARDIKTSKFNEFLAIYHEALEKCLKELLYTGPIPTFNNLQDLMKRDRFYAFFVALSYLPVILMPPNEDGTTNAEERLAGGSKADAARLRSMLNPIYAEEMKMLMPWLCGEGFMD